MDISRLRPAVLWLPVAALAAVQGAFTLAWVIYGVHVGGLLGQVGLATTAVPPLLFVEAVLAIALEPVIGHFSDRLAQRRGTRFPLIAIGVLLAAVLMLVTPLLANWGNRELLIALLIGWAIAMSVFRTPALALLRRYAIAPYLPIAASFVTLAAGIAGATRPIATPLITRMGAPVTFTIAAIGLLLAATALRSVSAATVESNSAPTQPFSMRQLGAIAIIGCLLTLAFRVAIEIFPKVIKAQVPNVNPPSVMALVFIAIALTAFLAGQIAVRWGNRRTMLLGLGGMAVCFILLQFANSYGTAAAIALGLGAFFAFVSNGTLPLVFALVQSSQAGLGVGAFFGGASIAVALLSSPFVQILTPQVGSLVAIAALLGAGGALVAIGQSESAEVHRV